GDPVSRLVGFRAADGSFGHLSNLTSFAIFSLRAAGYPARSRVIRGAAGWLGRQQNADGGFGVGARGGASDVDDTAAAVQALAGKPFPIAPVRRRAARSVPAGAGASPAARTGERRRAGRAHRPAPPSPAEQREARRLEPLARALGALIGTVLAPVIR